MSISSTNVTSSVGIFTGINHDQVISQLLAIDAQPAQRAQQAIAQIQTKQAAYLGINSLLQTLSSAASNFATNNIFQSARSTSSDSTILTATTAVGAPSGSYQFIVDRLASTQQTFSSGYTDADTTGLNLTNITFEPQAARLDSNTSLSSLNGGTGITRGSFRVTDSSGNSATIDLSRVETVNDVISAFASATNVHVTASVSGDGLKLTDNAGGSGTLTVENNATSTSLGLTASASGNTITGTQINALGGATTLQSLNDGLGVQTSNVIGVSSPDFTITSLSGQTFNIDIGDIYDATGKKTSTAVGDLAGVISRINSQTGGAVTASVNSAGTGLQLTDTTTPASGSSTLSVTEYGSGTTASDLGILGSTSGGTLSGQRLIASINSTLSRDAQGSTGFPSGAIELTTKDGSDFKFTLNTSDSVSDLFTQIASNTGGKVTAALTSDGTKVVLTDHSTGSGPLVAQGAAATAPGIDQTSTTGTITGSRANHQYIGNATLLSSLNNGQGIGTGTFEIVNSYSSRSVINVTSDIKTVGQLLAQINGQSTDIHATLNAAGDGIVINEAQRASGPGGSAITIKDDSGTVAKSLNLVGSAAGTGTSNTIDGSFEQSVALDTTDTLTDIANKINAAGLNVTAAVVNDGSAGRPYHLSITAKNAGLASAFSIDTAGADLGFSTLTAAQNSRVFYGNNDASKAILISTSGNAVTGLIPDTTVNLQNVSATPVSLAISQDTSSIETAVQSFADSFNAVVSKIDSQSTYDADSDTKGTLFGDSLTEQLRSSLFDIVNSPPQGVSSQYQFLAQIGLTVGQDGTLSFDTSIFEKALQADPTAVANLLAAKTQTPPSASQPVKDANGNIIPGATVTTTTDNTSDNSSYSSLGIGQLIANLATRYTDPTNGVIFNADNVLTDQTTAQTDLLSRLNDQIAAKKARLEEQFNNMESAVAALQSQQSQLSQIKAIS